MRAGTETLRQRFTWRRFQGKRLIGFLCYNITSLPLRVIQHSRTQIVASWRGVNAGVSHPSNAKCLSIKTQ